MSEPSAASVLDPRPCSPSRARWALLALLALSAVLRLWFMAPEPTAARWPDESIGVQNLCGVLGEGRLQPTTFWYGTLSYLPQTLVLGLVEAAGRAWGSPGAILAGPADLTPLGYRLCRGMQVAYGIASLWAAYLLGSEAFGRRVGLLGALLLAASGRHLQASATIKPDVLLLLGSLLALVWTLRALRTPAPRPYLLAGAWAGAATAAKLNGLTLGLPLLLAALLPKLPRRRRGLHLALAAGAAATVYLALNPWVGETLHALDRNRSLYSRRMTGSHLEVLGQTLGYLFDPLFHGPAVAVAAGAGGLLLAVRIARGRSGRPESLAGVLLLSYPAAYLLIYALSTTRAKQNHFLQLLPFTSLLAAVALAWAWEVGSARLPARLRPWLGGAGAVALAAWLAAGQVTLIYGAVVPRTSQLAAELLHGALPEPLAARLVVVEAGDTPLRPRYGSLASAVIPFERLSAADLSQLERADAEVFPHERLEGENAGPYARALLRTPPEGVHRIRRRWFRAAGPDLLVLLNPWVLAGESELTLEREGPARLAGEIAGPSVPGETISVRLELARRAVADGPPRLALAGRRLALATVGDADRHPVYLTPRLTLEAEARRLTLEVPGEAPDPRGVKLSVLRWSVPARRSFLGATRRAAPEAGELARRVGARRPAGRPPAGREPDRGGPAAAAARRRRPPPARIRPPFEGEESGPLDLRPFAPGSPRLRAGPRSRPRDRARGAALVACYTPVSVQQGKSSHFHRLLPAAGAPSIGRPARRAGLLLAALLSTRPATGQEVVPLGPDFQVNTYTTAYQVTPAVAAGPDGNFLMVWDNFTGISGPRARVFRRPGGALGPDFQTSTTTAGSGDPAVAAGGGVFVVVWQSFGSPGDDSDGASILGRRFDASGGPLGSEFQVNTYTTSHQLNPAVAADGAGNFVVVWGSDGSSGDDDDFGSIQARRFDAGGNALGPDFQVNTFTTERQLGPAVAADSAGNFVVVWYSYASGGSDSSGTSIQARRFDAAGDPMGPDFQVNSSTIGNQARPAVASDPAGSFVVAWHSFGVSDGDTDSGGIRARRFDGAGDPVGLDFPVNTYTPGSQIVPAVAADAGGGFVVTWQSFGSGGGDPDGSIQAQRFDTAGDPLGPEYQVNTYTTNGQLNATVAADVVGGFVVAWHSFGSSGTDTSYSSIQARLYGVRLFADGFETGDTSAWSVTVP